RIQTPIDARNRRPFLEGEIDIGALRPHKEKDKSEKITTLNL
ncbi:MAG: hypothetical protein RL540_402, partial [Actinomycetota bacterium]